MLVAQSADPAARVSRIALPAKPAMPCEVRVRQDGEVRRGFGATRISIDARDGAILRTIAVAPLRATLSSGGGFPSGRKRE
jgi:hypothetical protein